MSSGGAGGLGGSGSGSVDGGTADTGGPAWILPIGGTLLLVGLAARRVSKV
jgi:hypothetical protein